MDAKQIVEMAFRLAAGERPVVVEMKNGDRRKFPRCDLPREPMPEKLTFQDRDRQPISLAVADIQSLHLDEQSHYGPDKRRMEEAMAQEMLRKAREQERGKK